MNETLYNILYLFDQIISYGLLFTIIIAYYASLKKCFWKGSISRITLFLICLVSNPILIFTLSLNAIADLLYPFHIEERFNLEHYYYIALCTFPAMFLYLSVLFLLSNLIGRLLKASNKALVAFVILMYSIFFSMMFKTTTFELPNSSEYSIIFDILAYLVLYIGIFLIYKFLINALSKLTDKRREINSRLFILPLTVFTLFYNVFATVMIYNENITCSILINLFSTIILFLFVWAFSVIIKNINATNEAIEAKDIASAAAILETRIEADLSIAKEIQTSALPNVFPPFPDKSEFELFASMNAAKEVGGDFYDFYMLNDNTLGFVIADVSGKSIPGAMFMMTSKIIIKNLAEKGNPPADVFTLANEKLCDGNEAEMFVTAWLGYLDINTGLVRVANAGHNPPLLIRNGKAEYIILKPGLMLAGMEGVRYKEQTVQLQKGDILFLYTDGVTEAMNVQEEQYGENRLKEILSFGDKYSSKFSKNEIVKSVCKTVKDDIDTFTQGAEQSDDITMLCIRYTG